MSCASDLLSASEDLCAACDGSVILVIVVAAIVVVEPLATLVFASFCRGSFIRFAAAAAPRFEMEIAVDNEPCLLSAVAVPHRQSRGLTLDL